MRIIKKKSMIVAFISSLMLAAVLILTLVSYIAYLEIKERELKSAYEHRLGEVRAR